MPELLTPVGRMVEGSLYKANDKDYQGNPLITKTGPNAGQPRVEYYFAIAIPKGQEQHWSQTEWGQTIFNAAAQSLLAPLVGNSDFAWKIVDGDSQVPGQSKDPTKLGVAPCTKVGFPGHWVLRFSSGFAPSIHSADGQQQIVEPDAVKCGYFIQIYGSVEPNDNTSKPGVYLNHSKVAYAAYGEEIHTGADASAVGFGGQPLPPGASAVPLAGGFNPATPLPASVPAMPGVAPHQGAPVSLPAPVPGQPVIPQAPVQTAAPAGMPAPNAAPVAAAPYVAPTGVAPGVPAAATVVGNRFLTGQQ